MTKITKFDPMKVGYTYKKDYATIYYDLSKRGLLPHQIATELQIPQKNIDKWAKDPLHKEFGRAVLSGATACHAFWTMKLMEADNRTDIEKASTVLKTWFKEWNIAQKKETTVENKIEKMSDEEINKQLVYIASNPDVLPTLEHAINNKARKSPDLKVIDGSKDSR